MEQSKNLNSENRVEITEQSFKYFHTTKNWVKFLAIIGFVSSGLLFIASLGMLIFSFFLKNEISEQTLPFTYISIIYFVISIVNVFPALYLLKFSNNLNKFIHYRNTLSAEKAFEYQAKLYRYIGIWVIVILFFYLLLFIAGVVVGYNGYLNPA